MRSVIGNQACCRLQDALVRAGIQPDEHIRYPSSAFVAAVEEQLGAQPLVHCVRGRLTEVRFGALLIDGCAVGCARDPCISMWRLMWKRRLAGQARSAECGLLMLRLWPAPAADAGALLEHSVPH
jgi:hypothetical protein